MDRRNIVCLPVHGTNTFTFTTNNDRLTAFTFTTNVI